MDNETITSPISFGIRPAGKIFRMVTQPIAPRPIDFAPPTLLSKVAAALAGAAGLTVAAGLLFSITFNLIYIGRIMPGVRVAGINISGLSRNEAIEILSRELAFPIAGHVKVTYGDRSWNFAPSQLGLSLDAEKTARQAYGFGRSWLPWVAVAQKIQILRGGGADLAPRVTFDGITAHLALQQIAAELNRPTVEAELRVDGLDVQVSPGQIGVTLDTETTAAFLATMLLQMQDTSIPLAVVEHPPRILDASAQAEIARSILAQPMRIFPGGNYESNPNPWEISVEQLAGMLSVERVDSSETAQYQIGLNSQELGALLAGLAPQVAADPENARFIFNDETRQLEVIRSALPGRTLNLQASIEHINQQLGQGAHEIELQYDYTDPEIGDNRTAAELGISELFWEETTYFYGSSDSRIHNIATAAARFHGLLVPPQSIFSMVENIGDISLESGFAEALIIFGDRTIKGVGGGVCQVSTTLFRTAFFGGFPIIERYPHAYRVGYYEMNAAGSTNTNLVGLDATVYAPVVDFKFKNDTDNWLLMETYVNGPARTITWKFYSTSDGRTVEWDTTGIRNVVDAPDPVYEENPELSKGQVKQVDWSADGADVTITRWVYRNGEVIYEDVIATHYQPWADVYQYGPGTQGYPPKTPQQSN
jgi:vancomycin resistance protein YoaR